MNIRLVDNTVKNLKMQQLSDVSDEKVGIVNFSFATAFSDEAECNFLIDFLIRVNLKEKVCVDIEYSSKFETSEPITPKFRESHFPTINAPAIAYPFIRAYLSNLALNSGYEPILLPTVNFAALQQDCSE